MQEQPAIRASDAEREHAVARLRDGAAEGRLTLGEFADRMEQAYGARTRDELDSLAADLPATAGSRLAPRAPKARRLIVAVMSDTVRRGRWRVADGARAITLMGNLTLDLREAIMSSAEVTVTIVNVMGNTRVVVPDGVGVEVGGAVFLGSKEDRTRAAARPDAPYVRIDGVVVMGNLVVVNG